jgi:hypothetical protein
MTNQRDSVQHEILPIPDRRYAGTVLYGAKNPDATFAPIRPVRPQDGAANVLTMLIDDVGFGASGAFGMGGWSFYLKESKPAFCYNLFGIDQTYVRAEQAVPAGEHQVRMEFAYGR